MNMRLSSADDARLRQSNRPSFFVGRCAVFSVVAVLAVFSWNQQHTLSHSATSISLLRKTSETNGQRALQEDLLKLAAPFLFPMGPNSRIILPEAVTTVVIDVGARESKYLSAMQSMREQDMTTALFMFDPLPESFAPLAVSALSFSQGNLSHHDRVLAVRAAMGEKETVADFKLNYVGACGSLLQTGNSSFFCADTIGTIQVQVFTLASFLSLLDETKNYTIHIKIDAEGADLHVLKGAGKHIRRASSVIIECQDLKADDHELLLRVGSCRVDEAKAYMCQEQGFCDIEFEIQGEEYRQGNIFFTKGQKDVHVSPVLHHGEFDEQYRRLALTGSMKK